MEESARNIRTWCAGLVALVTVGTVSACGAMVEDATVEEDTARVKQRVERVAAAGKKAGEDPAGNRYIVVFKKGTVKTLRGGLAKGARRNAVKQALGDAFGPSPRHVYEHTLEGMAVTVADDQELRRLEANPKVAYVVPDGEVHPLDSPQTLPDWSADCVNPFDGPLPMNTPQLWSLDRIDQSEWDTCYQDNMAPPDNLYHYAGTGAGVHVYILDSGVNTNHPQFEGRIGEGYDIIDGDSVAQDEDGHGTHVAGIVAGKDYGVAKEAIIHPVRVLPTQRRALISELIAGVDWVTAHKTGPAVVNMSLETRFNQALNDAIAASVAEGLVYTVGAGNLLEDSCDLSPASSPDVLTVGATDFSDALWEVVTKGAGGTGRGPCVDLFAPGAHIYSADYSVEPGDADVPVAKTGTSQAAPHVAGAAALLLGEHPELTPSQVYATLIEQSLKDVLIADHARGGDIPEWPSDTHNRLLYVGNLNQSGNGSVLVDDVTSCQGFMGITVRDSNVPDGQSSLTVQVATEDDDETITLTETAPNSKVFTAQVPVAPGSASSGDGTLQSAHDLDVTVTYDDDDQGTGLPGTATGHTLLDCEAPILSGIHPTKVFKDQAVIHFNASEASTVVANFGTSCESLTNTSAERGALPPEGEVGVRDLQEETRYFYTLTAVDRVGHFASFDNDGACYEFTTPSQVYLNDFESETISAPGSQWQTTTECSALEPGHSPDTVLYCGSPATCTYSEVSPTVDRLAMTPIPGIDFEANPSLSLNYSMDFPFPPSDDPLRDFARVHVSVDGGLPITILDSGAPWDKEWALPQQPFASWASRSVALEQHGDGVQAIQLQVEMETTLQHQGRGGFSVDDIAIYAGGCKPSFYEAEHMQHGTGGAHPRGWNVWTNGHISFDHDFVGGSQQLVVTAAGEYGGNGWPRMAVRVNGTEYYSEEVNSVEWRDYSFAFPAPVGSADVEIHFTNDYNQNGEDRNLFIEKVVVSCNEPSGGEAEIVGQFLTEDDWGSGYCARLELTNEGTAPTTGWTVVFDTGNDSIFTSWSPTIAAGSGVHSATSVGFNSVIAPGETLPWSSRFGFCASRGSGSSAPQILSLE